MSKFYPASKTNKDPLGFIANPESDVSPLGGFKLPISVLENLPQVEFGMWRTHSPYGSIMNANVLFSGRGYAESTTLSVSSEPEHPEGTAAVLIPVLGLSSLSLEISGGSGHMVGDLYFISNEDSTSAAMVEIKEINGEGAISEWLILESGENFTNNSTLNIKLVTLIKREEPVVAPTIELIPDKFSIVDIILEDGGSGYMFWDETGNQMPIERTIVASNIGDGEGFIGNVDQAARHTIDPESIGSIRNNRSRKVYNNKYGKLSSPNTLFLDTRRKAKYISTQPTITHDAILSTILPNGIAKI